MEAGADDILVAVKEVMSLKEFGFGEKDSIGNWLNWISLPDGFLGYTLWTIIVAAVIYFFVYFLKDSRWPSGSSQQPAETKKVQKEYESFNATTPIGRLHALFLQSLQARNVVAIRKWKTNADYTQESGNPLFAKISTFYDQAVYGNKEISQDSLIQLNEQFDNWEKKA